MSCEIVHLSQKAYIGSKFNSKKALKSAVLQWRSYLTSQLVCMKRFQYQRTTNQVSHADHHHFPCLMRRQLIDILFFLFEGPVLTALKCVLRRQSDSTATGRPHAYQQMNRKQKLRLRSRSFWQSLHLSVTRDNSHTGNSRFSGAKIYRFVLFYIIMTLMNCCLDKSSIKKRLYNLWLVSYVFSEAVGKGEEVQESFKTTAPKAIESLN